MPPIDPDHPKISVLIPSHRRSEKLAACVRGLSVQTTEAPFEVLVGLDGPEPEAVRAAQAAWSSSGGAGARATFEITEFPKRGANEIRQDLLARARGDLIVTLNDDVAPEPGFLGAHLARHDRVRESGRNDVVIGHSPDIDHPEPTLLDRVVARTNFVFPWASMLSAHTNDPGLANDHGHGFRAAVTLNFSAPRAALMEVGGFTPSGGVYGHDDLELGHRLVTTLGARVLFEPGARALHDHRHTARALLVRDARLGASLWHYAKTHPAFARDLVGHDPTDPDRLAFYERWLATDRRDARRAATRFLDIAESPWDAIGDDPGDALAMALADVPLTARRWLWRRALLDASRAGDTGQPATAHADRLLDELLDGSARHATA